ncbi:MAG: beta-galactosidase [Gemmatimonadetes bacterium]|jgi:hypothetical protein|nr:beta-galactosidase [Gemmatimonadota bacterium]
MEETALMTADLRFRQIHLDFHTSEHIAGIGSKFDADQFADTLVRAHVDSITCFARCHHGWIYYDTTTNPERRHPHLERNLLAEQIKACHARGIRVPIYVTVQWDQYTTERHPEWICIGADGSQQGTPPYEAGFYRKLCVNTPYVDFLKSHVKEILQTLPTDGLFFDIVQPNDCSCYQCRQDMIAEGLDPADATQRRAFGLRTVNEFKRDMTAFVRQHNADCTIFYNAGHVGPRHRQITDAYTHLELESLPSGGWGYLHFPLTIRYARNLGLDCMGMTGKFHTTWGDFSSFKNPAALEYECFMMLANGAKCSVGDQLHPEGEICQATYDLVGDVYSRVEAAEPWCRGARPLTDIGVMTPEEFTGGSHGDLPEAAMGAVRMLQEGAQQFDIVDSHADLARYKVLILPDAIEVNENLATKLSAYVDGGGALLASHRSGLDPAGEKMAVQEFGVQLKGEAPYSPDFLTPEAEIGDGLAETGHVMYLRGVEVEAGSSAKVLASVAVPYFNRTHEHFCSHNHTPSSGRLEYPGIVQNGRCIYFAHPVFTQYTQNAPRWCKQLVLNALGRLLQEPLVQLDAPSTALATLNQQDEPARLVLHLLHYIPERRGARFDVLEDVIPLHDTGVSVCAPGPVSAVRCVPLGDEIPFELDEGRVRFVLPRLEGYQIIELDLA